MPSCEVYFSKMPVDTKPKIHEGSGRKSSKPLMEKRRRARINDSLGQLKSLILEATNKDSSRHSKLEKADILEMTVKHLRTLQRSHIAAPHSNDPNMVSRFRQGYSECIHEVARFFSNIENIGSPDMRLSLINHLANACSPPPTSASPPATQPSPPSSPVSPIAPLHVGQNITNFTAQVPATSPAIASTPGNSSQVRVQISPAAMQVAATTTPIASPIQQQHAQSRVDVVSPFNTNTVATTPAQVIPVGIPGTLPSGEITLVLPPQALTGGQLPSHFIPVYAQSAPVLTSPTISQASQGPTAQMESPPKTFTQVQLRAQTPTNAPQQLTAVQAPTLVAVPAPAPVIRQTKMALQAVPQPPSPPKTVLQTVHVHQQTKQEPVWRPWNHMQ